eukprot:GILK01012486.1.p1 GENE.GILK01012486.1~~GILK01012486.1.p1  ORF type:complete len:380 (+),score=51.96 GILK01012486.1:42-1142(+)
MDDPSSPTYFRVDPSAFPQHPAYKLSTCRVRLLTHVHLAELFEEQQQKPLPDGYFGLLLVRLNPTNKRPAKRLLGSLDEQSLFHYEHSSWFSFRPKLKFGLPKVSFQTVSAFFFSVFPHSTIILYGNVKDKIQEVVECISPIHADLFVLEDSVDHISDTFPSLVVTRTACCEERNRLFEREMEELKRTDGLDMTHAGYHSVYPSLVIPDFLYLGEMVHAKDGEILEELRITHVLSVGYYPSIVQMDNVVSQGISIQDNGKESILLQLTACVEFIEAARKANGRVLVHCRMGVSRSPTVVLAYLMYTLRRPLKDLLFYLQVRRRQISPTAIFLNDLLNFEHQLLGRRSCVSVVDLMLLLDPMRFDRL